jgi:hypothetical protein
VAGTAIVLLAIGLLLAHQLDPPPAPASRAGHVPRSGRAPTPASSLPSEPGEVAPWLQTRGTQFVTAAGHAVILRGLNAGPSDPAVYEQAARFGVNFVRVPVYWSAIEPQPPRAGVHHYDRAALASLDRELLFLRRRGVMALIDLHQFHWSPYFTDPSGGTAPGQAGGIPAWLYVGGRYPRTLAGRAQATAAFYGSRAATADYAAFAGMLAARYRRFANVLGYEILNEPPVGTLPDTHATTQRLIAWEARIRAAIAARDPERTVFFMLRGGDDLGFKHADLRPFGSLRHLALDLHDYYAGNCASGYSRDGERPLCTNAKTYLSPESAYTGTLTAQLSHVGAVLARTRAWGIPLLIGEWGAPLGEPGMSVYQAQLLAVFRRDRLSWARWSGPRQGSLSVFTGEGSLNAAGCQIAQAWRGSRAGVPAGCDQS